MCAYPSLTPHLIAGRARYWLTTMAGTGGSALHYMHTQLCWRNTRTNAPRLKRKHTYAYPHPPPPLYLLLWGGRDIGSRRWLGPADQPL